MNITAVLQFILLAALSLLLALVPARDANAQKKGKEAKKMHIKMVRTIDGKTEVIDTVLMVVDPKNMPDVLKEFRMDTTALRALGKSRIAVVHVDSLIRDLLPGRLGTGDSIRFRQIDPARLERIGLDSTRMLRLERLADVQGLNPAETKQIIVDIRRGLGKDSVLVQEVETRLNVVTDEKTGERKIYRIDKDGKKTELKGDVLRPGRGKVERFLIIRNADVQEISAEDKQALKDAGAPVETKRKEELEVEDIQFYPNPNNGRFTLHFTLVKKATTVVRIMDSKGNEVFVDTVEKLTGQYNREIDLSVFGPGIYYLQVAQGKRFHTKKILVQ